MLLCYDRRRAPRRIHILAHPRSVVLPAKRYPAPQRARAPVSLLNYCSCIAVPKFHVRASWLPTSDFILRRDGTWRTPRIDERIIEQGNNKSETPSLRSGKIHHVSSMSVVRYLNWNSSRFPPRTLLPRILIPDIPLGKGCYSVIVPPNSS
ncbi:hypothetical protein PUN28_001920 [Cardiocondyla obscurior]|uniref:Uncharacterized protein n=1 Tax=Cardiocondyla obscurior TaxID=286306 RepID=A0AAW2GRR3_9HYME